MKTINIAREFTRFPTGRYIRHGDTSGEALRERLLVPPLARGESLVIELDDTIGYNSSFLEEAFGGLVRVLSIPAFDLLARIEFKSSDPELVEEIKQYILNAGAVRLSA